MSENVLPRATACHATDCGNRNAQVSGYHQKGIALTPASSNLPDAGLGQLGVMDLLSASNQVRTPLRPMPAPRRKTLRFTVRPVIVPAKRPSATLPRHIGHVLGVRANPQVGRVYARRIVAVMQDVGLTGRNRPHCHDPRQSVREVVPAIEVMSAVSVFESSRPDPTRASLGATLRDRPIAVDLFPKVIWCILPHSSVEPPCPRFRGQGRSGATNTLAVRSFYHKMLSDYAGKAA